jgi:hypothetical protein
MDHITLAIVGASEATLQMPQDQPPFLDGHAQLRSSSVSDGAKSSARRSASVLNVTGEITWFETPDA